MHSYPAKLTEHAVETRQAILDAALDAFFEHGYQGATMRDIGRRVGLNSASLYYYFPSKEAILHHVMLRAMQELLHGAQQALAQAGHSPLERLQAVLRTHITFHGSRRKEAIVGEMELRVLPPHLRQDVVALRDRYERMLRELLAQGIAAGAFRPVDVALTVRAMIWACSSVVQWYRPDGPLSLSTIADYYIRLWTTGLLAPELPPIQLPE